jgi:hypothetical protein
MTTPPNDNSSVLRENFLEAARQIARYWQAELHRKRTDEDFAIEGAVFSMLCLIDGIHGNNPALDLSLEKNPKTVFNRGVMLHETFYDR